MSDEDKRVGADQRRICDLTQEMVQRFAPMQQTWVRAALSAGATDFEIHCAMWVFGMLITRSFDALRFAETEEDRAALMRLLVGSQLVTSDTVPAQPERIVKA